MNRMLRRFLTTLAIAAVAAALAGCGGTSGGGSSDPATILGATFSNKKPIKSGRMTLDVDIQGASVAGLPSPLSLSLGGPFESNPGGNVPKFQFDLTLGTSAGKLTVGAISIGKQGWVQIAGKAFTLPASSFANFAKGRPSTSSKTSGLNLADLGVDPRRWLENPKLVGTEELKGDSVVHVRSGVNVDRMLGDIGNLLGSAGKLGLSGIAGIGKSLSPQSRAKLAAAIQNARVDVWSGERDRLLRRILIDVDTKGTAGKAGKVKLDLTITNLNKPQPIGPPANPRPLSELTSALALLGAQRGGGTLPSAPPTPTTPQSTPSATTYDACITAAGADLQKTQDCAALLGK